MIQDPLDGTPASGLQRNLAHFKGVCMGCAYVRPEYPARISRAIHFLCWHPRTVLEGIATNATAYKVSWQCALQCKSAMDCDEAVGVALGEISICTYR